MKKLIALIMAVLMIATFTACGNNNGNKSNEDEVLDQYVDDDVEKTSETFGSDTFTFESIDSETVIITGFSSTNDAPHSVKIPAYVDIDESGKTGRRVVAIGLEAFCYKSNITTVIFPTEAEYKALDSDFDISTFSFVIEDYAFRDCAIFESVTIPAYVTELGKGAFYGCYSLTSLAFEEGSTLSELKANTFRNCTALTTITLPGNLAAIGECAFFGCTALVSVELEEGISLVSKQAFQNCYALEEILLPVSLVSIGQYAFHGSRSLYIGDIVYTGESEDVLDYIQSLLLEEKPAEEETTTVDLDQDPGAPTPDPAD